MEDDFDYDSPELVPMGSISNRPLSWGDLLFDQTENKLVCVIGVDGDEVWCRTPHITTRPDGETETIWGDTVSVMTRESALAIRIANQRYDIHPEEIN